MPHTFRWFVEQTARYDTSRASTPPLYQSSHSLLGAIAGNVTGLSALAANGSLSAVASNVSHLSAVTADDELVVAGRASVAGAITSHVTNASAVVALLLSIASLSASYILTLKIAAPTGRAIASLVSSLSTVVALHLLYYEK